MSSLTLSQAQLLQLIYTSSLNVSSSIHRSFTAPLTTDYIRKSSPNMITLFFGLSICFVASFIWCPLICSLISGAESGRRTPAWRARVWRRVYWIKRERERERKNFTWSVSSRAGSPFGWLIWKKRTWVNETSLVISLARSRLVIFDVKTFLNYILDLFLYAYFLHNNSPAIGAFHAKLNELRLNSLLLMQKKKCIRITGRRDSKRLFSSFHFSNSLSNWLADCVSCCCSFFFLLWVQTRTTLKSSDECRFFFANI